MLHVLRVKMVINSPWMLSKNWLVQKQMAFGKDISNPFMADNLPKLKQVGDISSHSTKYTSPALTQKVFANIRWLGKGFSRVDTPLFEGMLVAQEVGEDANEVHVEDVNAAGVVVKVLIDTFDDTVMDDVSKQGGIIANIDADEDVALEVGKDVAIEKSADVQESAYDQGRKVESQAKIYKIDLEHAKKVLSIQEEESEPTELQEVVDVVTTAKIITKVVTADSDTITAASTTITAVDVPILAATIAAAPTLTTAPITAASATITAAAPQLTTVAASTFTTAPSAARKRKGVVIRDPEDTATPSTIIHTEPKSKDKGKEIMVHEPKPLKKKTQIEQDKAYAREYQALKRKPQTEAHARKNMMIYLRNMAGFKMDYFKGMTFEDIFPIFKKKFNSNVAFLEKTKEQMEEEDSRALKRISESQEDKAAKRQKLDEEKLEEEVEELKRHLQIVPNDDDDDIYTEATPLALKVPVIDYEIYNENNKPYYKIKRADGSHQLYLSFLSLLRNFDREDLKALWRLPDIHAQIYKNQRSVHGQAKVKSWKLLKSCGVHIITFTTKQFILLVKRRYPLTRFTLDQMLNNVRLKVEEESEVSLELLRIEQYFLMTDYSHWEVILNGDSPAPTRVVDGVLQPVAPTTAEHRLPRRVLEPEYEAESRVDEPELGKPELDKLEVSFDLVLKVMVLIVMVLILAETWWS
nr:hypothetical protein [Tanacetum cinerariifolium]